MREQIAQSIVDFNIRTPKERVKWVQSQDYPHTALYIQAIEEAVAAETEWHQANARRWEQECDKMSAVVDAARILEEAMVPKVADQGGRPHAALYDGRKLGMVRKALKDLDGKTT